MLPPAPGTFSIRIGWPSASPAPSATMRATTSEEPPGPKGTTNLSGLLGNVCACAIAAKARPKARTRQRDGKRRFICIPSRRRCRESTPFRARTPGRLYCRQVPASGACRAHPGHRGREKSRESAAGRARSRALRSAHGRRRRRGLLARQPGFVRPGVARPHAAAARRHRGSHRVAQAQSSDARVHPHREGRRRGPRARPGQGRRRLSRQAVHVPRAARADPRAPPPRAHGPGPETPARGPPDGPCHAQGGKEGTVTGIDREGVRDPRMPLAPPGAHRFAGNARPRRMARQRARHAARQRHRRHHGTAAPQDRRSVREEAAAHRPRRGIRSGSKTPMRGRPLSVRARLTLWHAGVLALIVCVFSAGILLFVKASLFEGLDRQLRRALMTVHWVYHQEPDELKDLASESGITLFQLTVDGRLRYQTEEWERVGLARALRKGGAMPPESWTAQDGRTYRVQAIADPSYAIAAAIEESSRRDTLWTLAAILAMGAPFALGLAIAGGYFLAGRVLSPVGAMADKAREITADSLGERLPVDNPQDEFGRLATVFNDTLSRLHDSFDRLRRFTADASHELRTPLTAIRSVGEIALQAPLDAGKYRDVIGSMLEEVDRLTHLVESLLLLTRADSGAIHPAREVVELAALTSNVADHLRVLAEEKQQSLSVHAGARVEALCDPAILRLGLMNLLHNAIKYTPPGGTIDVRTKATASGQPSIEVQDTGPGIPAAHHKRIFERFYRADPA